MADPFKLRRTLDAVLPMAKLAPSAVEVARGCADAEEAIRRLESSGDLMSAVRLGAFTLPRREAVWWSAMCVFHVAPPGQPDLEIKAREAAEAWVRRQDDETRRQAMDLARKAGFAAPEAWCAVAAFWSGESISPTGQPSVPPAPHLAGTAVAGAVGLASVRADPARRSARLTNFLFSLRDIGCGGPGRLTPEAAQRDKSVVETG
jgi:hypothetical protein